MSSITFAVHFEDGDPDTLESLINELVGVYYWLNSNGEILVEELVSVSGYASEEYDDSSFSDDTVTSHHAWAIYRGSKSIDPAPASLFAQAEAQVA